MMNRTGHTERANQRRQRHCISRPTTCRFHTTAPQYLPLGAVSNDMRVLMLIAIPWHTSLVLRLILADFGN